MKKIIITTAIALLSSLTAMAEIRRVAVFDPAGNAPSHVNEIVREIFSSVIVNTDGYVVLERSLIDHVLAENRFQGTGLVDDAQISELGRLMGANLAFVTSLTRMSDGNFFVSARVIDVVTARIERQQTARTARAGETELINTAERLARDMFAQVIPPPAPAQPRRPIVEAQPIVVTADMLTVNGRRVSQGGRELSQSEVRQIMSRAQNFSALAMYDRGIRRNRNGNIWLWCGIGTIAGGSAIFFLRPFEQQRERGFSTFRYADEMNLRYHYYCDWSNFTIGIIAMSAGGAMALTGAIMKLSSRNLVGNSVRSFNLGQANSRATLDFDFSVNKASLTINF